MAKTDLTAERLRELLDYNPDTGVFIWRVNIGGRAKAGALAGWTQQGYRQINVLRNRVFAHHLVWFINTGRWPTLIDHINGNRSDNRIGNLRETSVKENVQNMRHAQTNNRSGFLGVAPNHNRWMATMTVDRKQLYFGTYDTPEEAHQAYLKAKRELHSTCTI